MRTLFLFILCISLSANINGQTNCSNGLVLTPGIQQCGDSNGNPGDFPANGTAPINPCSANHNDDEYWFTYTPGAGVDQLDLELSSISTFFTGLFVLDECPSNAPNCIAYDVNLASTSNILVSFPVVSGTTYKIAIITFGPPDGSSFCLDALEVLCIAPDVSLLASPIDSTNCPTSIDYSFQIDDLKDSGFLTITAEDEMGNQAGTGGVANSTGIFTITDIPVPQTAWIIKIAHENDPSCDIELGPFAFDCLEENDDLCDAIEIIVNASYITGSNEMSGSESMEPDGSCWSTFGDLNSVWYTFVAPASEAVTVSTDYPDNSIDDVQIAVYSFTDCMNMTSLVELACDVGSGTQGGPFSQTSIVNVYELTQGETYAIQVDGVHNDVGDFKISVSEVDPDHDDCENAKDFDNCSGSCLLFDEYFIGATPSGYGTAICDNGSTPSPNDLWYKKGFGPGTLTVTVDPGLNSDIVLSLYTGCFSQLFQSCSDLGGDGGSETLSITSGSFTTAYFRIYEKSFSGEPFDIIVNAPGLPITLGSFEAQAEPRGNQIRWSTLSESNSDYVEVQSSVNGTSDWKSIGEVKTKGESTSQVDYDFFDFNPFEETYYRLNAVDKDGTSELSHVITVKRADEIDRMTLTPNPARNNLLLQASTSSTTLGTYSIVDMSGKLMKQRSIQLINGLNSIDIEVEDLEVGLYLITLQTDDGLQVEKFVKQ